MGHAACDINAEKHEGHVEVKEHGHDCLNLEAERTECPEEKGSRNVREKKWGGEGEGWLEDISVSVAQTQVHLEAKRDLVQKPSQWQSLTRLEPKGPGDLHRLPYWATSGSTNSFTQQVVLQWIWPQVLFDNFSNPVRLWKAVV